MVNERIESETNIRRLREEQEYNQKLAALLEDKKKEQVKYYTDINLENKKWEVIELPAISEPKSLA